MNSNSRTSNGLKPWAKVIKEQQESLESLQRSLGLLREEENRLAAKAAVEAQEGFDLALSRLREDIRSNLEQQQLAERTLDGAAILLREQDEQAALSKRKQQFKQARRLAQQRESLAGDIERGVAAIAKSYRKLEELGRKLAETTPEQPGWLRASHPAYGDPLLRHLRLAFLQVGLKLDSSHFVDSGQLAHELKFRARVVGDDRAYLNIEKEY